MRAPRAIIQRRSAVSAAVLTLAVCALSATGTAYGANVPAIGIDPAYGPPRTIVKIVGTGFCTAAAGCSPVSILVDSLYVDGGIAVGADHGFTAYIQIPGTVRPGSVAVQAVQTDHSGAQVTARDEFTATTGAPAPTLYPTPATIPPPGGLPPVTTAPVSHSPAGASASPSPSASPEQQSADTPGPRAAPSDATSVAATAVGQATKSSDATPVIIAVVAGLLLAALGVVAVTVRRRRTR